MIVRSSPLVSICGSMLIPFAVMEFLARFARSHLGTIIKQISTNYHKIE